MEGHQDINIQILTFIAPIKWVEFSSQNWRLSINHNILYTTNMSWTIVLAERLTSQCSLYSVWRALTSSGSTPSTGSPRSSSANSGSALVPSNGAHGDIQKSSSIVCSPSAEMFTEELLMMLALSDEGLLCSVRCVLPPGGEVIRWNAVHLLHRLESGEETTRDWALRQNKTSCNKRHIYIHRIRIIYLFKIRFICVFMLIFLNPASLGLHFSRLF